MWFNKNSLFQAFWSGSATPRGEDSTRGSIRITFILTLLVLLSYSERQVGIQFHSCQLWTECLISVVKKRLALRLLLHLQVPCEMTLERREEAASLVDQYRGLFHRNQLRKVVALVVDPTGFQSSGDAACRTMCPWFCLLVILILF